MKKLLIIGCCDECTNFIDSYRDGFKGFCRIKNKDILDQNNDLDFPKWCPLLDFNEEKDL